MKIRDLENVMNLAKYVEKNVITEENGIYLRKYYRFRVSKHYGGSAVADVIGCIFNCVYCWNWKNNRKIRNGFLIKPIDVIKNLLSMAEKEKYKVIRISGGEPTIGFQHLIQVIEAYNEVRREDIVFVLETNGLFLGLDKTFAKKLEEFKNIIVVRISLKGCSKEEFEQITSVEGSAYLYQLKAVKNVIDSGFNLRIAVPISFCSKESFSRLLEELSWIDRKLVNSIEPEIVVLYPSVARRICFNCVKPWLAIDVVEMKKIKGDEIYELCRKRYRENYCKHFDTTNSHRITI